MIERLARYVATPSLSREEDQLASLITTELTAEGLDVRRIGNNVWCEIGEQRSPRLLLNSHLDTVPPSAGWESEPWVPRIEGGRLIGLGANDAKGCVVAMIEAALALHHAVREGVRIGGTVVLALTAEEENSGAGLGTILDRLGKLDGALVGEPTGLRPMVAQRGLLILNGIAHGTTSHPANTPPDAPNNAILVAAEDLRRLLSFDWGPEHPLLGRAHGHVTQISGGVARNVIPDRCEFWLDIRTTPLETHEALAGRLRAALRSDLRVHSERLVPVETPTDATIVQAVLEALPGATPQGSPAMSDMVYLAGTPTVKIGPGESPRSHTPNEFILEQELRDGASAYVRIARAFFARCNATRAEGLA